MSTPAGSPPDALPVPAAYAPEVDLLPAVQRVAHRFPDLPWLAVLDAVEEQAARFRAPWLRAFIAPAAIDRLR